MLSLTPHTQTNTQAHPGKDEVADKSDLSRPVNQ